MIGWPTLLSWPCLMDTCARIGMLCLYVDNEAKALNDVNKCIYDVGFSHYSY